jgi:hypothetical protein
MGMVFGNSVLGIDGNIFLLVFNIKKMATRRIIISLFILFWISLLLLTGCKTANQTAPVIPEPGSVVATVVDMRELDGCTYLLELEDGSKLQPSKLPVAFQKAGLKVRIKYKKIDFMSICMSGTAVELTYISIEK